MSDLELKPTIRLHAHRCGACGRWSASEDGQAWLCPPCNGSALNKVFADLRAENARLGRMIASLRGVITKLRRRA